MRFLLYCIQTRPLQVSHYHVERQHGHWQAAAPQVLWVGSGRAGGQVWTVSRAGAGGQAGCGGVWAGAAVASEGSVPGGIPALPLLRAGRSDG